MPLSNSDRRFLDAVGRFKMYMIIMAMGVLVLLLLTPRTEIRTATSVIGMVMCAVFWLTQRLLSFITQLDHELTRLSGVLTRTLTEEQRKELLP